MQKVSRKGLIEIASHEAIVLSPYLDSVGVWTVGIGHTASAGDPDPSVERREFSLDEIMDIFARDIEKFERRVRRAFGRSLTQEQFDAAVSFDFNTGGIHRATWVKRFNEGKDDQARIAFMAWRKPKEIVPRRKKERDLFFDGKYSTDGMVSVYPASSTGAVLWSQGKRVSLPEMGGVTQPFARAPKGAPAKRPVLRFNDRGRPVRLLQQELNALGYHVGKVDGWFWTRTRGAVLAFQADNDLVTDGIVGPATYEALADARPRLIGAERASASILSLAGDGSRIASASITQGATGALVAAGGALGLLEQASGTVTRITQAVGPFGDTLRLLGPWVGAAVLVAGAVIVWQSIKAGRARVEDHRTGKTA